MAGTTGLEPATSAVTGQRSNQLSYVPKSVFNTLDMSHRIKHFAAFAISLFSTISLLWTQFCAWVDNKSAQRNNRIKSIR
jgi:hypothetical protein